MQALKDNWVLVRVDLAQPIRKHKTRLQQHWHKAELSALFRRQILLNCSTAACTGFSPVGLRHFCEKTLYTEVLFSWVVESSACIFSEIAQY